MGLLIYLPLACFGVALYGVWLVAFGAGRRKRGVKILAWAIVAGVVAVSITETLRLDEMARAEGWASHADREAALAAGFSEPYAWFTRQKEQKAAEKAEADRIAREQAQAEAREAAERKRAGFHCLSEWDGSHRKFLRAVQSAMRDPDSFEHIETRVTPVDDNGWHSVFMEYRARNGFGGMNVAIAQGRYANDDCRFEVVAFE